MMRCETCNGLGRAAGHAARDLHALPAAAARSCSSRASSAISRPCDACGGERRDRARALHRLPRQRAASRAQQTLNGAHPARRRGRHAAAARGRGRGRHRRRAARRPLRRDPRARRTRCSTREGADLHCEVPIPFVQAALGAEIEVPTLEGKVALRIPEGTQIGQGDAAARQGPARACAAARAATSYVRIFVEVPTRSPTTAARAARAVRRSPATEVSPVTKGFLDKLRDLFD